MSVTLYMDHYVPAAITGGLPRRGVDVLTAVGQAIADLEIIYHAGEPEDVRSRVKFLPL